MLGGSRVRRLFAGGSVVAPDGSVSVADVAVEDGRILEVGSGLDADETVDVSGKHLLPGLFDCHIHLGFSHIDFVQMARTPPGLMYFESIAGMQKTIDCGITTVRDAGGTDLGTKVAVERGIVVGPRMQIAIGMLSQTGGHGDSRLPSGGYLFPESSDAFPGSVVDGPEEVRKAVREMVRAGADVLKVATSGGVLSPDDDPKHAHFQPDELEMMAAETAAAGLYMMAHAQAYDGIKNAVRAGFRSIDHGIYLDDEAIELMLERGTWLVPTLLAPRGVIKAAEAGVPIPPSSVAKAHDVVGIHKESITKAIAAGVKVAMGTDCPVSPHGTNLEELDLMVECGMTPGEALYATTQSGANLMGLGDDLGSIEPGKIADLVVVDGDPLDFASLKGNIEQVWKAGEPQELTAP
ncbi:MAG: amidohydrolase family protein [bacterium]|nr:amidohydrolase family protein [bacterium]